MDEPRGLPPEWGARLGDARAGLTVADEVGLALREHRRRLGMSQRAYAQARSLSRAMLARLEAGAGRMSLDTVVGALEGTGFTLYVGFSDEAPDPPPVDGAAALTLPTAEGSPPGPSRSRVPPDAWDPTDLVARVRGHTRRFPAHREVLAVTNPPIWWWMHEFFNGPTEKPKWYAPECPVRRVALPDPGDEADPGAA